MKHIALALRITALFVGTAVTGCGSHLKTQTNSQDSTEQRESKDNKDPQKPSESTQAQPPAEEPTFQYFAVIREFGQRKTGAIFGILPNNGRLKFKSVSGPLFLGTAHTGELNPKTAKHLFVKTGIPLSQSEKDSLLAKYAGAQVVYFENYNGTLCAGPDQFTKISISSSLGDLNLATTFEFTALPQENGNCEFHTLSTMTQF